MPRLKPPSGLASAARLPAPTTAQIGAVTDVLEHRWSSNALLIQDRLTQAIERDDHNAASKWALGGAISTDKILVLQGRPTAIVGHLHAHRHELSQVMDKLAIALRPQQSVSIMTQPIGPVPSPAIYSSITPIQVGNDSAQIPPST